ncbi:hypothetical protein JCM10450v2_000975 [Rhodotorula kratochvilovae]
MSSPPPPPPAPKPARRRQRRHAGPDRLEQVPLELLHLILSHLDLGSLLSLTLVSKALRAFVLGPSCTTLWLVAVQAEGLPELKASLRPVELASLVLGKHCRICGRSNARKVDYRLLYEGPDEPDPAFENFFHGTKRYTPRSPFFLLQTLESTSSFLATLLTPQHDAYHALLEDDPLAELDDFLHYSSLPEATRARLDERAEWVRGCWADGEELGKWAEERRLRVNAEKREERARKKEAAAKAEEGKDGSGG